MKYSKKKSEGFSERKKLLQEICTSTDKIVQNALSKYRRKDVARDDILDALVASLTANLSFQGGLKSIPKIPEKGSQDLPMQMVYKQFANRIHNEGKRNHENRVEPSKS